MDCYSPVRLGDKKDILLTKKEKKDILWARELIILASDVAQLLENLC
jgi:hypothetical protein